MARYPGAKWRPLTRNYTARATNKDCAILHSTASASARSMHTWFSQAKAYSSSHFHVDDYGVVEQYVDTAHMSWANAAANSRSVTIETQGDGTKPWTPKQREAIVALLKWICKTHGIPVRQMQSSLKSEKGIGWHRLGCDGNFPAMPSILAGRGQRGKGESWSSARGKVCPGSDRIHQIPGIITEVAGGSVTPAAKPKPTTPAKPAPKPSNGKQWPYKALPDKESHTAESHAAWVALLAGVGYKDKDLTKNVQSWLKKLGYYGGKIDGDFSGWTVEALQEFLVDKGFLPNKAYVDRNRGATTIKAEIAYLNSQARYYK